ncbi:NACHT, LRR and PYD domains-containing protein 3-like [Carassius carassius]|uniref:NACHT, LRR and PYD domains-containing protein 3-like n=1 Tax=Carassius carassius TaxID=217509 RepID=UPI0028692EFB|nr:NACHT, LRR and PYD domains-containing protein 3-like [Carassius carassius]XP_059358390.1 NACHT, LRR and PYD domains-containing protein 3-like [Carassius carassius]XP_059358391.1 NACHT, LRR and PYD domains-containing protein 3-like [Carassius carassius]
MSAYEGRDEDGAIHHKIPKKSPNSICMSVSNKSMDYPPAMTSNPRHEVHTTSSPEPSCVSMKSSSFIQLYSNKRVTSDFRVEVNKDLCHQPVDDVLQRVKEIHKTGMKKKYEHLFEGLKIQENETLLNTIYTHLYIIEGECEGVNEEHEVLHMEETPRTQNSQDTPIYCNHIFDPSLKQAKIKTVLTKGIAGIGKTVSVQKFILDWAEGKANQDVDFMFVLPFREINLVKEQQYSLHSLLLTFYPELQNLDSKSYAESKVVFIFDGLDESRISLFLDTDTVSDVHEFSSVGVLMSNLMKGELIPTALIWITSRPAAASQIPSKYINRVTEIQGFNDSQKEQYFRKRISDEHQASRIISHIRRTRSLHIMCHIPVFCWISATVLQNLLKQDDSAEIPQTLTEMYIHFLIIQTNVKNQKYNGSDPKILQSNKQVILKLAELAYKQLMKGNILFYEEDLKECSINVTDASVYSGICTEIFREEAVVNARKVYCFIHLSFQEFLAAFNVFYYYVNMTMEVLSCFTALHRLFKGVVDKALESQNGQFDLFLRFLLGISLESNQGLLYGLLAHTESSSESIKEITRYIKQKIKKDPHLSADRSICLFLCLLEVKDQTLYREIQEFLTSAKHSEKKLYPGHCSAIAYMLQMSDKVMDELDLKKYNTSEEGRKRLIPAVRNCRKALFSGCDLIDQSCETIASALQSADSLRELDLSNNDLQDSGVKLLCDGLKNPNCPLETLRLSGCMVTEEGCSYLTLALSSNPSYLRELDLSYNHPGDSGVKLLSDLMQNPNIKLEKLNLEHGDQIRITPGLRKYSCDITLDPNTAHTQLILSDGYTKVTYVKEKQLYPDHLERFENFEQVLSKESLSGRCYWEAEWSGQAVIAVSYKGISRKGGRECRFGLNEKSWILFNSDNRFTACHNNKRHDVPAPSPPSTRVGLFVDLLGGILSFYSVSNTLTHLHTFHCTFTEPLYAGFLLDLGSSASLSPVRNNRHIRHTTG